MARLLASYGKMHKNIDYQIIEEGRDYYRFSNGCYVPKHIVTFEVPKVVEEPEFEFVYENDY